MLSPDDAAALAVRIVLVAVVVSAVEPLGAWHFFDRRGPLSSRLARLQRLDSLVVARPFIEFVSRDGVFAGLCVAQLALSAAVFADPHSRVGWGLFLAVNLGALRLRPGLDGSDAMTRVVLAANAVRLVDPDRLATAFVLFVAAEACVAYFTSGFSKLGSVSWVEGRALAQTLSTVTYGAPGAARLLWRRPSLSRLLSWSTIGLEVAFPLALVLPLPGALALMAAAAAFHLGCARVMALGSFVWAFGSTYPCVVAARPLLPDVPSVTGGLLLLTAVALASQMATARRQLRAVRERRADAVEPARRSAPTAPDVPA